MTLPYTDAPGTPGPARRSVASIVDYAREHVVISPGVHLVRWIGDSTFELWVERDKGSAVLVASGTREAMHAAAKLQGAPRA